MQDKEVEKAQSKRKMFDISILVMGLVFVIFGIAYLFLEKVLNEKATFIYLMCWQGYTLVLIFVWLFVGINVRKKQRFIRENRYDFNREEEQSQLVNKFETINNQEEVVFEQGNLFYLGAEFFYDDLDFDYVTYQDNILLHIYSKENDENPLMIFVVTKEFYYCMKSLKINIEKLDKEIDMFNLNFKK